MEAKTTALPLAAFLLVLVIGAIWMTSGEESDHGAETDALVTRIAALEQQVTTLQAEVETLRSTPAPRARRDDRRRGDRRRGGMHRSGGPDADWASTATSPERVEAALQAAAAGEDEQTREILGSVIRDEMEQARDERREDRRTRRAERQERRLAQLVDDAGLSQSQHESLSALLETEREDVYVLFQAAHDEGNWGEARDQAEELRAATDDHAAALLSDEQAEAWSAMREEEEARRFGRR